MQLKFINMIYKKFIPLIILILVNISALHSQDDSFTLKNCYKIAYENYPNAKQKLYYRSINSLKLDNIGVNFLPQISFRGQASYQSDVTKFGLNIPMFQPNVLSKDQYKLTMDVKQLIYDGSNTSSQKIVESKQVLVDEQKVEVDLFTLKQKINDLYFSVLLLQEKKRVNELLVSDLKSRIAETESRIKNETAILSNLYILQAQLLQTEQEIQNIENDKIGSLKMLSELIGSKISESSVLSKPEFPSITYDNDFSARPEYKLFNYQKDQLNSYTDVVSSRVLPKVSAFGQAGYGRPGLNMLDNTFQPFYTVGLSVSWNPINWNSDNNEKQIYQINQKIVDSQRETFEKNLKVALEKNKSDIDKYEDLIKKDEELISLREKIVATTYSQLQNGTITSTVYLTELNNKTQSQLMLETHKVQLLQAKINYLTTKGNY
jgi:outer membrane protein TolC